MAHRLQYTDIRVGVERLLYVDDVLQPESREGSSADPPPAPAAVHPPAPAAPPAMYTRIITPWPLPRWHPNGARQSADEY